MSNKLSFGAKSYGWIPSYFRHLSSSKQENSISAVLTLFYTKHTNKQVQTKETGETKTCRENNTQVKSLGEWRKVWWNQENSKLWKQHCNTELWEKSNEFPTKSTQHANRVIKFVLLKNKQNIVVISEWKNKSRYWSKLFSAMSRILARAWKTCGATGSAWKPWKVLKNTFFTTKQEETKRKTLASLEQTKRHKI